MSKGSIQFALIIFIAVMLVAFALWKIGKWLKNKIVGCGIGAPGSHLHHVACDGTAVAMADDAAADVDAMPMPEYDDGMSVSAGPMSVTAGSLYGGNEYMY